MRNTLLSVLKTGLLTQKELFPELPEEANGLPTVTQTPCDGGSCGQCADLCPTHAVAVSDGGVSLDLGCCIGCQACVEVCPTGSIVRNRSTKIASLSREGLVLTASSLAPTDSKPVNRPFHRSLHVRAVSTGDSASDLEMIASTNAVFDITQFGVHFVASPRFADALMVTGPVPHAMQEPLRRCYQAMAEPRLVIALGTSAISGGLHSGGYAEANGVDAVLPVDCYIPGDPPHPWSLLYGVLLAMGRDPSTL